MYSDGEKLADEDCKFVTENVFGFHPDKQSKITDKMDHIRVNKHKKYQMTRCFFAVSSDGSAIDFSYRKCLENFVKQNNPEHSESFCAEYFKKPRNHAPNVNI